MIKNKDREYFNPLTKGLQAFYTTEIIIMMRFNNSQEIIIKKIIINKLLKGKAKKIPQSLKKLFTHTYSTSSPSTISKS